MIDKSFIENLKPAELELVSSYIYDLVKKKVTPDTSSHENMEVKSCPECGSLHFVKNGHDPKGRQKYLCRDCKTSFRSVSDTLFYRSKISYHERTSFIAAKLNGLTLEEESVQIAKSVTTCFHMRHKLYGAIKEITDRKLSGLIELDPTYEPISLKGTRPEDMPRYSRKRGKNNSHKGKKGFSEHHICIPGAIDEDDHMMLKITGLGMESEEKLNKFSSFFKKGSTIVSDGKKCILSFTKDHHMNSEVIPVYGGKKRYKTDKDNSLSSINQLHQEIESLKHRKHGVSTRHLQGYLDWILFRKKIRYRYEARNRRSQAYMKTIDLHKPFDNNVICKPDMPIDLYRAYGQYHYGIFADGNLYHEGMYDSNGLINKKYQSLN